MGTRPRRRAKILLAAASLLGTLLVLEIGLRVFDAVRGRSWNARTAWYWMFGRDPFLGFRGRPSVAVNFGSDGVYRHNADGFRDARSLRDIRQLPNRRLVVCVGESSTYGSGASDGQQAYPARLEAHLRRLSGDDHWVVYNAGMPAYSAYEVARLLELRLLPHAPVAVVMMDLRNDVEFSARILDDAIDYTSLPLRCAPVTADGFSDLCMRSSLVGFVTSRFNNRRSEDVRDAERRPEAAVTARGRAFYRENLRLAALACERARARLLLVDQPIFDEDQPPRRRAATAELRSVLRETCHERGLPLLAADRPLRESGFQSPGEVHLGAEGYDRLAALLAPQVLSELVPPPSPKTR